MELHADFTQRALVHGAAVPWVPSPMAGVERRMLDRIGGEVARATTIVRYAPGSAFSPHVHDGGEEFLVLEGVFSDEHGDYPAGSYVRNPPTSRHTPRSAPGCTIFVKLWQFAPEDRTTVRCHADEVPWEAAPRRPGVETRRLFTGHASNQETEETVRLERWSPNVNVDLENPTGLECLVLEGGFRDVAGAADLVPLSWLRLPPGAPLRGTASDDGAAVWLKAGHLAAPYPRELEL